MLVDDQKTLKAMSRRRRGLAALVALLMLISLNVVALASMQTAGISRVEPVPLAQEAQLGPWKIAVLEVVSGDAATQQVLAVSNQNAGPADGSAYLVVKVRVTNTGQRSYDISPDDFAATGASGNVRRFLGVEIPDPALDGTVEPGATLEGWVVLGQAADEQNLLMTYDSLSIPGDWADGVLALQDGATVGDAAEAAVAPNEEGKDPGAPAGVDAQIVTEDWAIQVVEVQSGEAVYYLYPESDYRTTALGLGEAADASPWIAFKVRVTNVHTGGAVAFLSPSAFMLADSEGNPITDVLTLTPPSPDASGEYYPGASREGWVVFEIPETYSGSTVKFLPNLTHDDPRYFSWTGSAPSNEEEPERVPLTDLQEGEKVITNDQGINLRAEPSTDGEIVNTLPQGVVLTVTGPSQEAGGYIWYPVKADESGEEGWIASEFLSRQ